MATTVDLDRIDSPAQHTKTKTKKLHMHDIKSRAKVCMRVGISNRHSIQSNYFDLSFNTLIFTEQAKVAGSYRQVHGLRTGMNALLIAFPVCFAYRRSLLLSEWRGHE